MTYTLNSFTAFTDLDDFRDQWDQLAEDADAGMFMSFDWIKTWWKFYGKNRELVVHMISSDGKLVAVLPYLMENLGWGPVRFRIVKLAGSDFLPVTIKPAIIDEHVEPVIKLSLSELSNKLDYDLIHLGSLSGDYADAGCLFSAVSKWRGKKELIQIRERGVQTFYHLASDIKDQLAGLGKQERKKIRRCFRDIENLDIAIKTELATADDSKDHMREFIRMHQEKWTDSGHAGHFGAWPLSALFHEEVSWKGAMSGRLRLLAIYLDNRIVGYKYAYRFNSTYYAYLDAREELDISRNVNFHRLAYVEQIKQALSEGVDKIDSMRGEYKHKLSLGGTLFPVHDIFIYGSGLSRYKGHVIRAFAWSLNLLYYKIYRRRLSSLLGSGQRNFNSLWIRTYGISF